MQHFAGRKAFRNSIGKIRNPNGKRHYLNVSGRPIFDGNGEFIGYRGSASDITDRIEAQREAERAHTRLAEAIEAFPDGFALYDDQDRLVLFNSAYREIYPMIADQIVAGVSFEALLRRGVSRGEVIDAVGREEEWIAGRMKQHHELKGAFVQRLADGRWLRVNDSATKDGGRVGVRADITELKMQEAEITKANALMNQATRIAGLGIHETDLIDDTVYWSDQTREIYGVGDAAVPSLDLFFSLVHPEDWDEIASSFSQVIDGLPYAEAEFRIRRPDGVEREIFTNVRALHDPDGKPIRLIGTILDITERKRAEQALRDSEARFRGLIEGSIQGVIVHRGFRPLYANQTLATIFGHGSPDEVLALDSLLRLVEPRDQDRIDDYRDRREAGKPVPEEFEFQGRRKDGVVIWLETRVMVVDWDGTPATQATVIDITERKEAEQALRASQARFRNFAESAGDWFWEMDENLRFSYMALNIERLSGFQPEWYYGKTREDMLGADYDRALWDDHLATLQRHEPFRDFLRIVLERDGHSVVEANDGETGMRLLETQTIDVIITDIIMPNKEGIETIIEVRRAKPEIKIIAISGGSASGDYLRAAESLGADRIFAKPISSATITEAVRDLIG
ncbi:MAG: PAS domain S-box protein [Alphaproteobacteria bacterium]